MELGTKLKNARVRTGLSQEDVSESIGISRQTLSSWENEKTYPDIISLIKLSDLYTESLDDLLKENQSPSPYVHHIDKAINAIKKRKKIYKCLEIGIYVVLLAVFLILYHTADSDTQHEIYTTMYNFLLPCLIVIITLLIGVDDAWGKKRWFLILFFGITFGLANVFTRTIQVFNEDFDDLIMVISRLIQPSTYSDGAFLSFVGLGIGALARKFNNNSISTDQE